MLQITKIFRFEMAHAIGSYPGKCKYIHGHSYELHVTVAAVSGNEDYIPGTELIMDFKELKQIVNEALIQQLDHRLVLSKDFIQKYPCINYENLLTWDNEPSAENMLIYTQRLLREKLPSNIRLLKLKLFETNDSYAEWIAEH